LPAAVRADNCSFKTSGLRERHCFRKIARSEFNLVARCEKLGRECLEERDVRRVCEIDP
jgi:hypothetical protein